MQKCIFAQLNIFLWKMYAKMHFGIKFIFASNAFLHSIKCICNILLMQKCIFAKQNVMQKCSWCKNAFLQRTASNAFLHSITFSKGKCDAKQNVTNAFDAALTFCWCWTFSFVKCSASHFPKENVQHHKGAKCSAQHLLAKYLPAGIYTLLLTRAKHNFIKMQCFYCLRVFLQSQKQM